MSCRDIFGCFTWQAGAESGVSVALDRGIGTSPNAIFQETGQYRGIWEVRAQSGTDAFRLLGFFAEPAVFVLTNGFAKKTQKTPPREIAIALRRRAEYIAERKS